MLKLFSLFGILIIGLFACPQHSSGLMSTGTYTIFADSVDAGGVVSVSGTYTVGDTLGELAVGSSTGGVYQIVAGFQSMDNNTLEIIFNTTTVNLGNLVVGVVASSSVTITVTTTALDGYILQAGSDGGDPIAAVSDGEVTAGQEEYGVAVVGPDAAFLNDRAIPVPSPVEISLALEDYINLAASDSPKDGTIVEVIFKASITNDTLGGSKTQSVNFLASGNF